MAAKIVVHGQRETSAAFRACGGDLNRRYRGWLRDAGEPVRSEASALFSAVDARSAAGYRVKVRARGVAVEQTLRRTTGEHGGYGALQMRLALIPALDANENRVVEVLERGVDGIARAHGF